MQGEDIEGGEREWQEGEEGSAVREEGEELSETGVCQGVELVGYVVCR